MKSQSDGYIENILSYAQKYNFKVFPCDRSKRPLTQHSFKDATSDEQKIKKWWAMYPNAPVGIATGEFIVIDVDPRNGGLDSLEVLRLRHEDEWLECPTVHTGGGGFHYYFLNNLNLRSGTLMKGIDLKASGGYVIAPPSIHQSGKSYEWKVSPGEVPLGKTPEWLLQYTKQGDRKVNVKNWMANYLANEVAEGERNIFMTKFVGKLFRVFPFDDWENLVPIISHGINIAYLKPPLPVTEVHSILKSIVKRELTSRSQGKKL